MKAKIELPKTIQELQALGKEKIMEMWLRYFEERPTIAVRNMERALWYKIQCEQFKLRIEQKHITRLNRYSAAPDKFIEKSYKTKYHLKSGTEIVKIYKGRKYSVLVKSTSEFVVAGRVYGTLSAAALAICGKKVSGYDFFGLNNKLYQKSIVEDKSIVSNESEIEGVGDEICRR